MTTENLTNQIDAKLVLAWLTARSMIRGLPRPVPDRGGFRVDTQSDTETCRWVFPTVTPGLIDLANKIDRPRHLLKLCGSGDRLTGVAPIRWALHPPGYMMIAPAVSLTAAVLPSGFKTEIRTTKNNTSVHIIAPDGDVAARGYAVETADVFIYDRIRTYPEYRRKGLGSAVMATLGAARRSSSTPEILVATEDGRKLYSALGWSIYSPYATISIPE